MQARSHDDPQAAGPSAAGWYADVLDRYEKIVLTRMSLRAQAARRSAVKRCLRELRYVNLRCTQPWSVGLASGFGSSRQGRRS